MIGELLLEFITASYQYRGIRRSISSFLNNIVCQNHVSQNQRQNPCTYWPWYIIWKIKIPITPHVLPSVKITSCYVACYFGQVKTHDKKLSHAALQHITEIQLVATSCCWAAGCCCNFNDIEYKDPHSPIPSFQNLFELGLQFTYWYTGVRISNLYP